MIFRILPCRDHILYGVLNSDLVGFHTYDYARHFINSCSRILFLKTNPNGIFLESRYIRVGVYPIGIDTEHFLKVIHTTNVQNVSSEPVLKKVEELKLSFKNKITFLGVDRLDYIKGIPQKLIAFESFLRKYPELGEKV